MVVQRIFKIWWAAAKIETTGLVMLSTGWVFYSRNSKFVTYTTAEPEFGNKFWKTRNPHNNPPVCIDMCEKKVSLSQLKTTDSEALTRGFASGVFGGWGFEIQRRLLERSNRTLEGRDGDLWEREDLAKSQYQEGTRIADHFEVVARTPTQVAVRCGDSPTERGLRGSDGVFSMEVDKDDKFAYFRMKSFFFNSTPEGASAGPLSPVMQFLHRQYTKVWMEFSVRQLLK
ncbi:hypothetical protein BKA62DRAFT_686470 [Auriculariales sp. MPI-PUGE-AT-0066]|nr:hypothetical protein BKA62DRAFT_686470 [Auriculariales sp. MPI-PUGE-AT-0066]